MEDFSHTFNLTNNSNYAPNTANSRFLINGESRMTAGVRSLTTQNSGRNQANSVQKNAATNSTSFLNFSL